MNRKNTLCAVLALLILAGGLAFSTRGRAASSPNVVVFTVNDPADVGDLNPLDDLCDSSPDPGEQCTLRAAIEQANDGGGGGTAQEIHFDLPGAGPHLLAPFGPLPQIEVPLVIDGTTQPGASCPTVDAPADLQIVVDGSNTLFQTGLWLDGASSGSTIRGLVIGHFGTGIRVRSSDNQIECNHIGVAADGVTAMGMGDAGVSLDEGSNNTVGGLDSEAQRNLISANGGEGIFMFPQTSGNLVANNYIGTTADGLSPLANEWGVTIGGSFNNTIGGPSFLAPNVLAGNLKSGLRISDDAGDNTVFQNLIGVGADGTTVISNGHYGVEIHSPNGTGGNNLIGDTLPTRQNVIAHNGRSGVYMLTGGSNPIRGNQIFNNTLLGIDLGGDLVDVNDPGDGDSGPNDKQNYPVLTSATEVEIAGTLDSAPNQTYEIDFYVNTSCDPSGHGEGEAHVGTTTATTDASGHADFSMTYSGFGYTGDLITATATDPFGNTSEFSACLTVDAAGTPTPTPTPTPPPGGGNQVFLPLISLGPPYPTTAGDLEDGNIFTGLDGVTLGAVTGTLTDTLPVSISYTFVPTPTMIADSPVHGKYYRISTDRDVDVRHPAYFVLGLPVPDGVPTDTLGVGAYDELGGAWAPLTGFYDEVSELMLVQLSRLTAAGQTLVLIENGGLNSQNPVVDAGFQNSAAGPSGLADFEVQCMNTQNFDAENCNSSENILADFLALVYIEFDDMDYAQPWLSYAVRDLSILDRNTGQPSVVVQVDQNVFKVFANEPSVALDKCGFNLDRGMHFHGPGDYWIQFSEAGFCFNFKPAAPLTNAQKRAIRHMYFHALQAGYDHVKSQIMAGSADAWVIDSTAAAAAISIQASMESSNDHPRRPVDIPLESTQKDYEFSAQDFWVYHGRSEGIGLTFLRDFLQLPGAARTEGVIAYFGGTDAFKNLYWRWVKNQTMLEDGVLLNDDDTGVQCTFQAYSLVDGVAGLGGNQDFWVELELQPLTSHVLKLEDPLALLNFFEVVNPDWPGPVRDPDLQYKVYVDGSGCAGAIENDYVTNQTFSETDDFYVVIANVHPAETRRYRLQGD